MNDHRMAIFIDGGYLDHLLLNFDKARINYFKLCKSISSDIPLLRTYYYHCLPYQSHHPTPEQEREFANAQKFQRKLSRLESFTVRRGRLAYRGTDDSGKMIFEQKRVDVHMATDLVMHSTKRLISHAAIITGDSDFIPAVEVAQSEGVHISLYYSKKSSTHDELLDAVDDRIMVTQEMINEWRR